MVKGPIPWDKIKDYGVFHGLDYEAVIQVCDVIRQIDIEHAEREASKRALAEAAGKD